VAAIGDEDVEGNLLLQKLGEFQRDFSSGHASVLAIFLFVD